MNSPRVCICMATHNPPERLFRRQIESIRRQTHDHWICLIQDDASRDDKSAFIRQVIAADPRFVMQRNERTLGFYLNFERVLRRVPRDCPLVSLADQDDAWYPHKTATLVAAMGDPVVTLAFADMRIVDEAGHPIPEARHAARRRGPPDLQSLFFTNTVTGAAAMFRAALLPAILPFPTPRGTALHDWWIAMVALACGRIDYIDQPLHDYCQHGANALGWRQVPWRIAPWRLLVSARYRRAMRQAARTLYQDDCRYLGEAIETLCQRVAQPRERAAMHRLRALRSRPMRTMSGQFIRALLAGKGTRRKRHLLLAQVFGRGMPRAENGAPAAAREAQTA